MATTVPFAVANGKPRASIAAHVDVNATPKAEHQKRNVCPEKPGLWFIIPTAFQGFSATIGLFVLMLADIPGFSIFFCL